MQGGVIQIPRSFGKSSDFLGNARASLLRARVIRGRAASSRPVALHTTTIYLRDIAEFDWMNAVWEGWLASAQAGAPARTTVQATLTTDTLRVEVTVVGAAD